VAAGDETSDVVFDLRPPPSLGCVCERAGRSGVNLAGSVSEEEESAAEVDWATGVSDRKFVGLNIGDDDVRIVSSGVIQ
jgi:hypothetical protein